MLKKETILFLRCIAVLIFTLLVQKNGYAQNANEIIDISEEFKKIDTYNEHIKTANYYHYEDQKITAKKVSVFFVGLSGAIGAIALIANEKFEIQLLGGLLAGASIGLLYNAFEERDYSYYQYEIKEIEATKALFKTIPN
jgi:hypothetical protein